MKRGLEAAGGYGGDFATVLSSLRELGRADVVLSTVDTVGIPLFSWRARGRCGCRSSTSLSGCRSASRGFDRAAWRAFMRGHSAWDQRSSPTASTRPRPFEIGSESEARTCPSRSSRSASTSMPSGRATRLDPDVVSVGVNPHRDFELLLAAARELPDARSIVVASAEHARSLGERRRTSPSRRISPSTRCATGSGGAGRRTAGARQQLLRRDDSSAPGDGAREARRRDADGRDRNGLRACRR